MLKKNKKTDKSKEKVYHSERTINFWVIGTVIAIVSALVILSVGLIAGNKINALIMFKGYDETRNVIYTNLLELESLENRIDNNDYHILLRDLEAFLRKARQSSRTFEDIVRGLQEVQKEISDNFEKNIQNLKSLITDNKSFGQAFDLRTFYNVQEWTLNALQVSFIVILSLGTGVGAFFAFKKFARPF